jgi:hypothetical protein
LGRDPLQERGCCATTQCSYLAAAPPQALLQRDTQELDERLQYGPHQSLPSRDWFLCTACAHNCRTFLVQMSRTRYLQLSPASCTDMQPSMVSMWTQARRLARATRRRGSVNPGLQPSEVSTSRPAAGASSRDVPVAPTLSLQASARPPSSPSFSQPSSTGTSPPPTLRTSCSACLRSAPVRSSSCCRTHRC